jgi:DNA-binding response OmpR family regulator
MARILVVEDEPDIQEVLDYNLKRDGHEVTLTSTAKEGLRLARDRRPDLVLLDLMLPDGSGTDLCKTLPSRHHHARRTRDDADGKRAKRSTASSVSS